MKNLSPSINSLAVATYFASNISATINQGLSEKLLKESKVLSDVDVHTKQILRHLELT